MTQQNCTVKLFLILTFPWSGPSRSGQCKIGWQCLSRMTKKHDCSWRWCELRVPFEKSADQKNQLEQIELRDIQRRTWIRFETERWPSVSASYRKTHIHNSKTTIQTWILKPSDFVYRRRGLHQVNQKLKKLQLQLFSRHTGRLSEQTSSSPPEKL